MTDQYILIPTGIEMALRRSASKRNLWTAIQALRIQLVDTPDVITRAIQNKLSDFIVYSQVKVSLYPPVFQYVLENATRGVNDVILVPESDELKEIVPERPMLRLVVVCRPARIIHNGNVYPVYRSDTIVIPEIVNPTVFYPGEPIQTTVSTRQTTYKINQVGFSIIIEIVYGDRLYILIRDAFLNCERDGLTFTREVES